MAAEVLELLLADARTPSGGFAHSGGLEAALAAGAVRGTAGVPGFIAARLETVGRCDAALAAAACRTAAASPDGTLPDVTSPGVTSPDVTAAAAVAALLALDDEALARIPSPPLRRASGRLGRALLRTARIVWPADARLAAYAAASEATPRPVALGVAAAAAGMAPAQAARLSLYEDAATVASAAVKLLAVEAAETAGWVAALAPRIAALAEEAAGAGALPSTATPLLDARAARHDLTEGRLFAT